MRKSRRTSAFIGPREEHSLQFVESTVNVGEVVAKVKDSLLAEKSDHRPFTVNPRVRSYSSGPRSRSR